MAESRYFLSSSQSNLITLLRSISVLFIVSCHILQGYSNNWAWIFNIGVSIFFCISAFLFGKSNIDNSLSWLKKRAVKILLPFYIYIFFVSIVIFIFDKPHFSIKNEFIYLFSLQGLIGAYDGLNHLWFLTWILICYIFTPIMQKNDQRKNNSRRYGVNVCWLLQTANS